MYFAAILYSTDLFRHYQPRDHVLEKRKDWAISIVHTNTGLSAFQIKCAHLWNSLPSPGRDPFISSFKGAVYRYLLKLDR